ncbi:MAG TPA: aldehyde dehydrogenase family protein [Steroidobacteraceae bacterium]|nr:aldehyde dehydrogenase family protein [Steroidobacteraceae bacterium]
MTHANYIGGAWQPITAAARNVNPSDTTDLIGEYALAGAGEVALAAEAAQAAFPAWSRTTPLERAEILERIAQEILARRAELADLLAREEGKTLAEALGEATRAGQLFRYFAQEALHPAGEYQPSIRAGVEVEVTREPVGVVGLVTPWNFPLVIPAWKIAPALAYGNCVLFKPAELVPGCAWALADIIVRAGVPPGVFNLLMGEGATAGAALVADERVRALSFTGSVKVGRGILATAAARGAKVQLEMGGKNALVVLADADLDLAVRVALEGAFFSTGQRCTASSRLIVEEAVHERFVTGLTGAMRAQVIDDARRPGTTIGPVVDARQLEQDLRYLEIGVREGARLVCGGEAVERARPGFYLTPALFTDSTPGQRINQEEIFGPIASVQQVRGYEEALAAVNGTAFGLCAGICTRSLKHARAFQRDADVGMVMVNLPTAGIDYNVPFGGRRASGYGGKELASGAREFYTQGKTAYFRG